MNSRQGEERGRERPTPSLAQTFIVVPMPHDLPPGVGTVASPHCEDDPACQPRAGPLPVTGTAQLEALGPHFYKPKGCALGGQTHCMWLPGLVLWTKCRMAYLYLHPVAFILCTKAASAFAISVFNPLVSRELL